ncbi:hypothetical protein RHGRI_029302 [Rhododendron griersonianum]|uniref:Uncharacterized protein n=1 Tax=Rhododendron griersonianum TaxID=479676 RepID=A0AAV6IM94_9ERIC|nr:hypothetical protein RHGRI_029302 [Rhododendron griersonianum]
MKDLLQVTWRCLSLLNLVGRMLMEYSWKAQRSVIRWVRIRRIIHQLMKSWKACTKARDSLGEDKVTINQLTT